MLSYEEFKKKMEQDVSKHFTEENKECKVISEKVRKINGEMDALLIKMGDVNPVIYIKDFYDEYKTSEDYNAVVKQVLEYISQDEFSKQNGNDVIHSFMQKENVVYYLINAEKNKEMLEVTPHRDFLDLAIVYRLHKDGMFVRITDLIAKEMGLDEQMLYDLASKNTPRLFKIKIDSLTGFLGYPDDEDGAECGHTLVIYNDTMTYGACSVLYEGVLKEISERFKDDLVLMPSSIHEFFIAPKRTMEPAFARETVRSVNADSSAMKPEEILSDNAYVYHRENGLLEIA